MFKVTNQLGVLLKVSKLHLDILVTLVFIPFHLLFPISLLFSQAGN